MLYDTECKCQPKCDGLICKNAKEDGVEPVGKIDWFDPMRASWLRYSPDIVGFNAYLDKWRKAYTARGWDFPYNPSELAEEQT